MKPFISVDELDEAKPFAVIYGHDKAFFAQTTAGHQFHYDGQKQLIESMIDEKAAAWVEKKRAASAKASEEAKASAQPVAEVEVAGVEEAAEADEPAEEEVDGVNILAWARGRVQYPAPRLQHALKKAYGVNKPSFQQMILFLVEEKKLLTWEQAGASLRAFQPKA